MKINALLLTLSIGAAFALAGPAQAADETKTPTTGDKLLKGATDTLKSVTNTEESVTFKGKITNVDSGAREFRTTGQRLVSLRSPETRKSPEETPPSA
jgi:hypothetical protein